MGSDSNFQNDNFYQPSLVEKIIQPDLLMDDSTNYKLVPKRIRSIYELNTQNDENISKEKSQEN